MYQKCPVCNGVGNIVSQHNSNHFTKCKTCNGTGIISELTGLPPLNYGIEKGDNLEDSSNKDLIEK